MTRSNGLSLVYGRFSSPLGPIAFACTESGLRAASLPGDDADHLLDGWRSTAAECAAGSARSMVERTGEEFEGYFAGRLQCFTVPLDPAGTPFQRAVWRAVCAVPYAHTATYGALAELLARPRAARAVGHANGSNPLPIVVPCHRLVGSDGRLRGYAGGLEMKRWLLDHEQAHLLHT